MRVLGLQHVGEGCDQYGGHDVAFLSLNKFSSKNLANPS